MKHFLNVGVAIVALAIATPAMAGSTNGFGVGTSAVTGQYLDIYGTVANSFSAYRMQGDSSGNYTSMQDVAPVSFDSCWYTNAGSPGICSATHTGTTGPGFDATYSISNSGLLYNGGAANASTYADLSKGSLGANGSTSYYQTALTVARFVDTLTFNVGGADASTVTNIIVKFQLDGGLFAPDAPLGTPGLGGRFAAIDNIFSFGGAGGRVGFNLSGANPTYGVEASLVDYHNDGGWVSSNWDVISPGLSQFTGVYALTGGEQTLGISNYLRGFAQSIGSFEYGNTSSLSFVLPTNVTFTSASGTFLSALNVPTPGGVPEPATWAMMILGFGMIGAAQRRRSAARLAVAA